MEDFRIERRRTASAKAAISGSRCWRRADASSWNASCEPDGWGTSRSVRALLEPLHQPVDQGRNPPFGIITTQANSALTLGIRMGRLRGFGVVISLLDGGAMQFADFRRPLARRGISSVMGVAADLANADDAGRGYLIGVAAAFQYAIFPV